MALYPGSSLQFPTLVLVLLCLVTQKRVLMVRQTVQAGAGEDSSTFLFLLSGGAPVRLAVLLSCLVSLERVLLTKQTAGRRQRQTPVPSSPPVQFLPPLSVVVLLALQAGACSGRNRADSSTFLSPRCLLLCLVTQKRVIGQVDCAGRQDQGKTPVPFSPLLPVEVLLALQSGSLSLLSRQKQRQTPVPSSPPSSAGS